ncbi:MAG: 2-C-methyl-D-erythritol 4-phosphate cytidylyltransferase, partial [Candidatus Aminicenantes bacterium]|nr:2-C-methyl-D-erythritol 4-phosphate cytidylyltransferase [Candidatus Aminicenantes bacterium]
MTRAAVLIVAAGEGRRFGGAKQFALLGGRPVLAWSVAAFAGHPRVDEIILVLPPGRDGAPFLAIDPKVRAAVDGGPRRQDSVRNGFACLAGDGHALVLVHDGVRPFVCPALIDRVLDAAAAHGAAVPALEVEDTIKEARNGRVIRTLVRDDLVRVQTPQGFRYGILRDALGHARETG